MIRAGELRHRVSIMHDDSTEQDTFGQPVEDEHCVATVWAKVESLSGLELIRAQQVAGEVTHQVTIRHYPGLTNRHWFNFQNMRLDINHIDNVEFRNIKNVVLCKRAVQAS